jgi:mycoredoxin
MTTIIGKKIPSHPATEVLFYMNSTTNIHPIILYTSNWCAHAMSVEGFLEKHEIPVNMINIDGDREAREELIRINGGHASVPTLIFPDGSKLTEPSFGQLRQKLELSPPAGLVERIRSLIGRDEDD